MQIVTIEMNQFKHMKEVLQKENRPYYCKVELNKDYCALIPFRSHIHHKYSFKTDVNKGIDFTKSIIIRTEQLNQYIIDIVSIDNNQWKILKRNQSQIAFRYKNYINKYLNEFYKYSTSSTVVMYSTLQNFHYELNQIVNESNTLNKINQ